VSDPGGNAGEIGKPVYERCGSRADTTPRGANRMSGSRSWRTGSAARLTKLAERRASMTAFGPIRCAGLVAKPRHIAFRPRSPPRRSVRSVADPPGCLQSGATSRFSVGSRTSSTSRPLRREINLWGGNIPGIFQSIRPFLYGSSAELVRFVGHTLNARRKGMRGRQWWLTPSSASPRIQHRADRKRSRREHSTDMGARFVGRALWSLGQRDERRRRRW
jgi:hypothetical protein